MSGTVVLCLLVAAVLASHAVVLTGRRARLGVGGAAHRLRALGHALLDDEPTVRRGVWVIVAIAFALRLAWVVIATRAPTTFQDPAEYLRTAQGFLDGDLPTFLSGAPSAFWAPGYPAVLAPFLWVADVTGWASPAFTAALVNVVGATVTVALSAYLAGRWVSPRARVPAAVLVALTPGLVYWTSTAHTESVFTAVLLGALALVTVAVDRPDHSLVRWWLAAGALIGFAILIRGPGSILLLAPLLAVRAHGGRWRSALRPTALVLLGSTVFLVPWAIRNGIQVGVWTPTSTSNALPPCEGNGDHAEAQFVHPHPELVRTCFRDSPYDDVRLQSLIGAEGLPPGWEFGRPDEARWYQERLRAAARWAVTHPVQEVRLSTLKAWEAWEDEDRVVEGARNFSEPDWAGSWSWPLAVAANVWLWLLEALALAGLLTVSACRRALPIWGPIALATVLIMGGVAFPHYRNPVLPLVAVLGAGFVVGPRAWRPSAHRPATGHDVT